MSNRHKYTLLIPPVILSFAGMTAFITKAFLNGFVDAYDICDAASCLTGVAIVCTDRKRAFGRVSFRNFTVSDHMLYWLLMKLSCSCVIVGLLNDAWQPRLIAGVAYLLLTVLIRAVLMHIKRKNAYC